VAEDVRDDILWNEMLLFGGSGVRSPNPDDGDA